SQGQYSVFSSLFYPMGPSTVSRLLPPDSRRGANHDVKIKGSKLSVEEWMEVHSDEQLEWMLHTYLSVPPSIPRPSSIALPSPSSLSPPSLTIPSLFEYDLYFGPEGLQRIEERLEHHAAVQAPLWSRLEGGTPLSEEERALVIGVPDYGVILKQFRGTMMANPVKRPMKQMQRQHMAIDPNMISLHDGPQEQRVALSNPLPSGFRRPQAPPTLPPVRRSAHRPILPVMVQRQQQKQPVRPMQQPRRPNEQGMIKKGPPGMSSEDMAKWLESKNRGSDSWNKKQLARVAPSEGEMGPAPTHNGQQSTQPKLQLHTLLQPPTTAAASQVVQSRGPAKPTILRKRPAIAKSVTDQNILAILNREAPPAKMARVDGHASATNAEVARRALEAEHGGPRVARRYPSHADSSSPFWQPPTMSFVADRRTKKYRPVPTDPMALSVRKAPVMPQTAKVLLAPAQPIQQAQQQQQRPAPLQSAGYATTASAHAPQAVAETSLTATSRLYRSVFDQSSYSFAANDASIKLELGDDILEPEPSFSDYNSAPAAATSQMGLPSISNVYGSNAAESRKAHSSCAYTPPPSDSGEWEEGNEFVVVDNNRYLLNYGAY
ncbi:hypothetical protein PENTCL1PPCAC_2784, partial [Pristionchus entomophagus]